jgi:hypothetical protein
MNDTIDDWKKYLKSQNLYSETTESFRSAMRKLDNLIAAKVPSTKGMIWRNGNINPNASISDVHSALLLLPKLAQANLDDLGDPADPNRLSGTPMNSLFISQEDSKLDEWTPENNQNQSKSQNAAPNINNSSGNKTDKLPNKITNINDRMNSLMNLIENVKK